MSAIPPILRIDLASPVPGYRQIVDGLRAMLVAGAFQPGQQLPTVRQLAVDLGVHHNTVAEAYRMLAEEGWLDLARRRGAVVLERPRPRALPLTKDNFERRVRELAAEAIANGLSAEEVARSLNAAARQLSDRSAGSGGSR